MIRAVLVDDEPLAIQELEYILSKISYVKVVSTFTDAMAALKFIKVEEPDVVFLDIDMPQITGIQLTEQLKKEGALTQIIYATAYDEYALKAFDQSALDYLLKPYDEERIYAAVLKLKHRGPQQVYKAPKSALQRLPIWMGEKMLLINFDEILYCSVENNKAKVYTEKMCYEANDCLVNLEDKLPADRFMRTHRSYIVNLSKIQEISPYFNNTLVLKIEGSKEEIPVSRSYLKAFKSTMNIN